ncbi:zf-HC2 domain-containing protein [Streptomyces sp. NPDC032472]|uniref:zf-HC2 domain-containing protein n=1 Tax=Streptomyces sp. NPDC032472 TaxID=3155018 RepID=UPI0033EEA1F2
MTDGIGSGTGTGSGTGSGSGSGSAMMCEQVRLLDAELALGILPGRERARALAHLDHCPDCRVRVERLTPIGDGLLALLPGTEPPLGFESRTAPRLRHRPDRRRLRLALAAAALAAACAFGGWAAGTALIGAPPATTATTTAAPLLEAPLRTPDGRAAGRVFAHPGGGGRGWIYMVLDLDEGPAAPDRARCVLTYTDGTTKPLGSFPLEDGYGYWAAPATVSPALASARVLTPTGTLLATATFGAHPHSA